MTLFESITEYEGRAAQKAEDEAAHKRLLAKIKKRVAAAKA